MQQKMKYNKVMRSREKTEINNKQAVMKKSYLSYKWVPASFTRLLKLISFWKF